MSVISVENISKRYLLKHLTQQQSSIASALTQALRQAGPKLVNLLKGEHRQTAVDNFWALKDISFDIAQGERVGIIGKNGAGKSTLLKILSRITEPTKGCMRIRGRVASLLEVGTGFNPELTGRENIFLNGAILGMSRNEIARKFDEIVAFAEVEKFLDTPVKHYSSGMYMRLAFAVAAHLAPETLIVDEVLAVGDAHFQRKCLGKMEEAGQSGRTILFVSHNMQAVTRLCNRVICLDNGAIVFDGAPNNALAHYMHVVDNVRDDENTTDLVKRLPEDPYIEFKGIKVNDLCSTSMNVRTGENITVEVTYRVKKDVQGLRVNIELFDMDFQPILRSHAHPDDKELRPLERGIYTSTVIIPANFLAPISYKLGVFASLYNLTHCFEGQGVNIAIDVRDDGEIKFAYALSGAIPYKVAPLLRWKTNKVCDENTN